MPQSILNVGAIAALLAAAVPLSAAAAETGTPPQRTITLEVYGAEKCPVAEEGEIVVCARRPESDRYRIPKALREKGDDRPSEAAWGTRVSEMEEVSRPSMPGSCSVVGSGGQTGCFQQMISQWLAARRGR